MKLLRRVLAAIFIVTLLAVGMSLSASAWLPVSAQYEEETPTPEPGRTKVITVKYSAFEWWLISWSNNTIACQVFIDHDGRPSDGEIGTQCDEEVYATWLESIPCPESTSSKASDCPGYYLHLANAGPAEKTVEVELPMPQVMLSLEGCQLNPPENRCDTLPSLVLTGDEPLPNETVIRLQGTIQGRPFSCPGNQCAIPLQPTGSQGLRIEFWADSSFGDSSPHYTAQVRALPWGDFAAPEGETSDEESYYVDVISSQFMGGSLVSCSDVWEVFPEIGGPPPWLSTPRQADGLISTQDLYYLAGKLIENGALEAEGCPDGGLEETGAANACGLEAARDDLVSWQNQFDEEIMLVARDTGIPAQLIKNVFNRESQFWPGLYKNYEEAGLGQMTEMGADTLFLWNPDFFQEFCPLVLDRTICRQRLYGSMTDFPDEYDYYMTLLRGSLVAQMNSECSICPVGIDLSRAKFSIRVFAETMQANCNQVAQAIINNTERMPGEVSSFVDLWKYTLVNYTAGPGCLGDAIERAWNENERLNWDLVSSQLDPVCQAAVDYVEDIASAPAPAATPTPVIHFNQPAPTATPEPPPEEPIYEEPAPEDEFYEDFPTPEEGDFEPYPPADEEPTEEIPTDEAYP